MSHRVGDLVILFLVFCVFGVLAQETFENEISNIETVAAGPNPIVLWHGMGDSCCTNGSMGAIKKFLEEHIQGVYVTSLRIGNSADDQKSNSYFMDSSLQITTACEMIRSDPQLQNGYHAVGFSQGGLFIRALAQRCPSPPILNLVTFGAPHQGVYGVPRCPGESSTFCNLARELLNFGAYTGFVQRKLVQAQYWHDPLKEDTYRRKSLFLADINNERTPRNVSYADNLNKLKNFVLVQFQNDTMVDPKESETFGWYVAGQGKVIQSMDKTALYQEDWIGLRKLNEAGRMKIYELPGDHLQIDMNWFASEIIPKYLS